ncbi:hypothetical protein STFR1_70017 [Bacillus vallismortis]
MFCQWRNFSIKQKTEQLLTDIMIYSQESLTFTYEYPLPFSSELNTTLQAAQKILS